MKFEKQNSSIAVIPTNSSIIWFYEKYLEEIKRKGGNKGDREEGREE